MHIIHSFSIGFLEKFSIKLSGNPLHFTTTDRSLPVSNSMAKCVARASAAAGHNPVLWFLDDLVFSALLPDDFDVSRTFCGCAIGHGPRTMSNELKYGHIDNISSLDALDN